MENSQNIHERRADEISIEELFGKFQSWLKYLLFKWYIIFIAGILGAVAGFFYANRQKPIYTATTTFVLEGADKGNGLGQYAGIASMMGVDLGGGGEGIFQGDNLLELYKSRKMLEATLLLPSPSDSSLLLIDRYLHNSAVNEKKAVDKLMGVNFKLENSSSSKRLRDSVLQKVVANLNKYNLKVGKLDKKSSIFKIEIQSPSEIFSKEFNELLVQQVNEFYVRTKTKKSLDNIAILQRKTDSVRAVMNGDIGTMAAIIDATPNLNPVRQAQRVIPTQRSQFSAETNKLILGQLVQNLELAKISLMKETPLIEVLDEPRYPIDKKTFSTIAYSIIGGIVTSLIIIFVFSVLWWLPKLS
ncbi:hypothetical protein BWD42_24310 [Sphingobacterium sp. CZ-UAM]|uniref:hypothetical protein n=1 Tax=Sphingobacterium sp. CZ-UAM TaxID=1933868 RepID=UPI00098609F9|nr:hypothetical protein [Sphingobacterium sp. CZ-UAM]OOG15677.1 hypothetical protein BWD42_24310 [Sphingobacterium sp. CZ-UAM]